MALETCKGVRIKKKKQSKSGTAEFLGNERQESIPPKTVEAEYKNSEKTEFLEKMKIRREEIGPQP